MSILQKSIKNLKINTQFHFTQTHIEMRDTHKHLQLDV